MVIRICIRRWPWACRRRRGRRGTFTRFCKFIWWRLDRAHTLESVEVSGQIGALAALRCGTTTLIDHHASPNAIDGSLTALERGIASVGCRGVLCYEVTDRNRPR